MKLPIVSHPHYEAPLKSGHRFPMSKYGYLRRRLGEAGLVADGGFYAPVEAGLAQIALAHDVAYAERVFARSLLETEIRRIGLPLT